MRKKCETKHLSGYIRLKQTQIMKRQDLHKVNFEMAYSWFIGPLATLGLMFVS